jgi:hypothetical protein
MKAKAKGQIDVTTQEETPQSKAEEARVLARERA